MVCNGGGASCSANTLTVTGPTGVINTQADSTGSPVVSIGTINVPAGSTLAITGSSGSVTIDGTGSSTGAISAAGAVTVSGNLAGKTTLYVGDPTGVNPLILTVGDLKTGDISGQIGTTSVNVPTGGSLTVTGTATINNDLTVTGSLTVGATSANGATTINAGANITIVPDVSAPIIANLKSCANGGTIMLSIPKTCDDIRRDGANGTLFISSSVALPNFKCGVVITGQGGCIIDLTVTTKASATGARRLLSGSSSCGTATITNTGGTYNLCQSQSSAYRISLSYTALFVTLFVSLFLKF